MEIVDENTDIEIGEFIQVQLDTLTYQIYLLKYRLYFKNINHLAG